MPYSEVTVAGYNASPPPDDGSAVAANEVTWAGIKTKIGDPIKTAFDTCQTNITAVVSTEIEVNDWAPATTARIFYQAAPPTNWTKSVLNNDKAIRIVSGLTGGTAGGTTAFSSVLAARTILQVNLPAYNLSYSLTAATHTHTYSGTTSGRSAAHTHGFSGTTSGISLNHTHGYSGTTSSGGSHSHTFDANNNENPFANGGGQTVASDSTFSKSTSTDGSHTHTYSGNTGTVSSDHTHTYSGTTGTESVDHTHTFSGTTSASGALAVSGTISLGGSGTAMDFAIQYMDCIVATKD